MPFFTRLCCKIESFSVTSSHRRIYPQKDQPSWPPSFVGTSCTGIISTFNTPEGCATLYLFNAKVYNTSTHGSWKHCCAPVLELQPSHTQNYQCSASSHVQAHVHDAIVLAPLISPCSLTSPPCSVWDPVALGRRHVADLLTTD